MNVHRVLLLASLLTLSPCLVHAQALQVALTRTAGSLDEAAAQGVLDGARGALSACTSPGAQSYRYELSLRVNGTVREAAYDRRSASDARGARCIRHALLELHFPAHDQASSFTLTLGAGAAAPPPATTTTTTTTTIAPPPSTTVAPTLAPPPTTGVATGPVELGDVRIGPLESTPERTADLLRSVVAAQLGAISACYATGRRADATLGGEAILHATIGPDGRVSSVLFQAPEALASALAGCVATAARTWTFSSASAEERASIPLAFGAPRPQRR